MTLAAPYRRKKQVVTPAAAPRDRSAPIAALLLAWYDRHRRVLPWRAATGERADPYRVWLSEIMLQQTTVRAVAPYYARFLARFPDVQGLAAAPLDDVLKLWAGLGYYARARNLHACAIAVAEQHCGIFPDTEEGLRTLPGIGPYTAAAIAAIAFDRCHMPVDGNVERVISRLHAVEEELPRAKPEIARLAQALMPRERPGDFAQAMMDLGATICTPKSPACALCPFMSDCAARKLGLAETFPRKGAKSTGALRRGAAFVVIRGDDSILLRARPAKGLLGGMSEVPTTAWSADYDLARALAEAPAYRTRWRKLPGVVTHTFTHFPLELTVYTGRVPADASASRDTRFVPIGELANEALPNVMRKVIAHAIERSERENA
jgi:A/G-specific adenine glycosylase